MKRAHQNHRKSNAVEARKTNTTMRTNTERTFKCSRFTYSFSLITSNPFLLSVIFYRQNVLTLHRLGPYSCVDPTLHRALTQFFFLSVAYSHKFSSRFSDCQILYPILTAINDKRYDAAIKPSRLHITVAIKTMILSTTSIFRAILIVSAFFDTQTYTALGYPVSVYVCSECCVQYGVGTDYSA